MAFRELMPGAAFKVLFKSLSQRQSFKGSVEFYFPRLELRRVRAFPSVMFGEALLQI
jgi:hypothetical protein